MVPAALAAMANTPIGASLTIKWATLARGFERGERLWRRLSLSLIPMSATPTAMQKRTTAGMMLSAIERKGLDGIKRSRKLIPGCGFTRLLLKNEADSIGGKENGIAKITANPIPQNSNSSKPAFPAISFAVS